MTSPAAPGFARLNPRIPLLAFAALWLAQSGCWLLRESREELGYETGTVAPLASPVPSLSFEDPLPAEAAAPLPDCPFTSKMLEALNDTSDTADSRAEAVDVPASDIMGASTSSVPMDVSSAPAETNVADRAASLRYRGYWQTHQGGLIAFVEDLESKTMHRLETGDRIHEWTLQAIARKTKLSRDSVRNYCRWHHLAGYGRAVAATFREEQAYEDIGYGMESPAHRPAEACGI